MRSACRRGSPNGRRPVGEVLYDLVAANGWKHAKAGAETKADKLGPTIIGGSEKTVRQAFSSYLRADSWRELGIHPLDLAESAPSEDHPEGELFRFRMQMGARLQGFPDDWEFKGSKQACKRQIGNALPPVMGRAVGLAIYGALTGVEFDYEAALKEPLQRKRSGKFSYLNAQRDELEETL